MVENISRGLILNKDVLLGSGPSEIAGFFATDASKNNHTVVYMIPRNDSTEVEPNIFKLSDNQLNGANIYLERANKNIRREWPTADTILNNHLRRDYYLVQWCQRIYSFGNFVEDSSLLKLAGDLAWSAQMYVDRFIFDQEPLDQCELYMYDLKSQSWFMWNTTWYPIIRAPTPFGTYAVLGNNMLNKPAAQAIDNLWQ